MKYEKWSLGYWILKKYVQFADWIIYRKVIINGTDKIPKDRPIVFAPNHQNALSDPMAVLLHTKYQPVWLARADIFKNKTAALILRFLKIMPVYRMRDGKDQLLKNEETFANSVKVLENHFALGLFPEAAHTGKRQMFSHKKAVPRIVFKAEEDAKENLNIQIIPTGIYYTSYWKFNRNLIVNFGDPIPVNEYLEEFKTNPASATLKLRDKIYEEIGPLILEIKSKNHYADFETIRELYGKHYLKRQNIKYSILNLFKSDRVLAQKLDALEIKNPDDTETIIEGINTYNSKLKKIKIRTWLVENHHNNLPKLILNKLILLVGLPIFLFGFIMNAIPFFAIDFFVRKKIKDVAFWSTFFLALGIIVFPIFYIIELLAYSSLLPGIWLKIVFSIGLPISGKLAFKWYILFRKTLGRGRLILLKVFKRKEYYALFKDKELLYKKMDELISV